jgi:hypothetical protein
MHASDVYSALVALHDQGVKIWAEDGHLRSSKVDGSTIVDQPSLLTIGRDDLANALRGAAEPINVPVPITYNQRAVCRAIQRAGGLDLYAGYAYRIRGLLEAEALRFAVSEVANRHQSLRTRIVPIAVCLRR